MLPNLLDCGLESPADGVVVGVHELGRAAARLDEHVEPYLPAEGAVAMGLAYGPRRAAYHGGPRRGRECDWLPPASAPVLDVEPVVAIR
eukprot:5257578-Pyramimonas_sp.AAC.1